MFTLRLPNYAQTNYAHLSPHLTHCSLLSMLYPSLTWRTLSHFVPLPLVSVSVYLVYVWMCSLAFNFAFYSYTFLQYIFRSTFPSCPCSRLQLTSFLTPLYLNSPSSWVTTRRTGRDMRKPGVSIFFLLYSLVLLVYRLYTTSHNIFLTRYFFDYWAKWKDAFVNRQSPNLYMSLVNVVLLSNPAPWILYIQGFYCVLRCEYIS